MRKELTSLLAANFPDLSIAAEHLPQLCQLCELRRLPRHGTLLRQGDPVLALFGIVSGEITSQFRALDGRVSLIEHVGVGRLFGLASFATGLASTYDAVASRPTRVVAIGPQAYTYMMDRIPGFARGLLRELARRHHAALQQLEASRHRAAMERLTLAIAQLLQSGRAGPPDAHGRVLLRATQAELAALANLSRQTTNELIGELARQKRVRPVYAGLWVTEWGLRTTR